MSGKTTKPDVVPPSEDGLQPWLGLVPYSEGDRGRFFGREQDTLDLLRLVRRDLLTVLFGRSGTGKSSLLRAGLFPKLREEGLLPVWIRLDHSGITSYGWQVRVAIQDAIDTHEIEVEILNEPLGDEADHFWEYLHRTVLWDVRNQPVTPVLVFDQFEEIFTIGHNRNAIEAFLDELGNLAENHIPAYIREIVEAGNVKLPTDYDARHYKLIISLREDFVSRLDGLRKDMPSIMHNRHALAPMTGEQALEVVLKPGGGLVDDEVARRIVRFVAAANEADPGIGLKEGGEGDEPFGRLQVEPALLSLVCSELNLRRIREGRNKITLEQVRASSHKILTDFYERGIEGLDESDKEFIEDRLVTASGFRTAVPVEDAVAADLTREEIALLINRYLLRQEDRLGIPHIELTHDVLTKVVVERRRFRREREEEAKEQRRAEEERREREKARKMKSAKRARWIATAVAIVFAWLAGIAIWMWGQAREFSTDATTRAAEAEAARKDADARALALNAVDAGRNDPELALLLSIESAIKANENHGQEKMPREIELALRTAARESLIRKRYVGHGSQVYSVDFDTAGERLATGAAFGDATARIWDVESGDEIARLDHRAIPGSDGHPTTVSCVRFSPDGKRIVTATYREGGHVYVWDVEALRHRPGAEPLVVSTPIGEFDKNDNWVTAVAISPDGTLVASGGYDDVVRIWDLETRKEVRTPLSGHGKRIRCIVFSKDGNLLLTASDDGTAKLWDLSGDAAPVTFDAYADFGKRETLHNADISPSGDWIATGGNDHRLRLWNVREHKQVAAESHPDGIMGVAFIDDSRIVSVCNDATIRFWELARLLDDDANADVSARGLRLIGSQRGHGDWIRDVAVSPDKRSIATAGKDGTVRRWALPPGGELAILGGYGAGWLWNACLGGGGDATMVYTGMADGRVEAFVLNGDELVKTWRSSDTGAFRHNEKNEAPGPAAAIRDVSCSPDGTRLVTACSDQTAIVWDARTGEPLFRWLGHKGATGGTVYQARFSPDGRRVVSSSNDGTAQVWTVGESGEGRVPDLVLVPTRGRFFYRAQDLLDAGTLAAKWRAREDPVSAFFEEHLTDDERQRLGNPQAAAGTQDVGSVKEVLLEVLNRVIGEGPLVAVRGFEPLAGEPVIHWLATHEGSVRLEVLNRLLVDAAYPELLKARGCPVYGAQFSRDGRRIVTADFNASTATVWDASTGSSLLVLEKSLRNPSDGHSDNVVFASFSPDGTQVVTACKDGYCRVWNSKTGELEVSIPHKVAVSSAEYSSDGSLILTAAADGTARLWDVRSGHFRSELRGHRDTAIEARFSGDGRYILTTSRDGTVRMSYTDPWDLYSLANHRITRKLTMMERKLYDVTRPLTKIEKVYYGKQGDLPAVSGSTR